MQNRKTILAAAVAAAVGAPAAQAEMTVYGRVNNALDLNSLGAESSTHLSSINSRFGLQADTTLDSGLTVHGRYEFAVISDREASHDLQDFNQDGESRTTGVDDVRLAFAGISGGFGRVDVGNLWSAYSQTFGTHFDPFYSLGYYLYSSAGGGLYSGSNTIKYSNSWGPVSMKFDLRINDTETGTDGFRVAEKARGQGYGIGMSFKAGQNLTIAAAYDFDGRPATMRHTGGTVAADNAEAGDGIVGTFTSAGMTSVSPDETRLGVSALWDSGGGFRVGGGFQSYSVGVDDVTVSGTINGTDSDAANNETVAAGTIADKATDVSSFFIRAGGDISEKTNWLVRYAWATNGSDEGELELGGTDDAEVSRAVNASGEANRDATQLTWGVYHNAGGGLRLYYEGTMLTDDANDHDGGRHLFGIRVDF